MNKAYIYFITLNHFDVNKNEQVYLYFVALLEVSLRKLFPFPLRKAQLILTLFVSWNVVSILCIFATTPNCIVWNPITCITNLFFSCYHENISILFLFGVWKQFLITNIWIWGDFSILIFSIFLMSLFRRLC